MIYRTMTLQMTLSGIQV